MNNSHWQSSRLVHSSLPVAISAQLLDDCLSQRGPIVGQHRTARVTELLVESAELWHSRALQQPFELGPRPRIRSYRLERPSEVRQQLVRGRARKRRRRRHG